VRRAPQVVAAAAIAVALVTGAAAYATDRLATGFSARTFNASPPDWLDRSGLGPATYLVLPQSDYFLGTNLESWNREVKHVALLQAQAPDPFPASMASVERDGRLVLGHETHTLVVNVAGSAIGLDGRIVARPIHGLVAYRIPPNAHVHWLADGLAPDRWTSTRLRYQAWPVQSGRYELTIAVPRGEKLRNVRVAGKTITVRPGTRRHLSVPTNGGPLEMRIAVPDAPALQTRYLGVKVLALRFVPS
jgi:hypothetical protein